MHEHDRAEQGGTVPPVRWAEQATSDGARAGTLVTPRGSVPTPLFMPVATAATVKGVVIGRVSGTGAGMV
ncbi:MAG: hypothetical protein ACOYK7_17140, partial [Pirellulales bacterium]